MNRGELAHLHGLCSLQSRGSLRHLRSMHPFGYLQSTSIIGTRGQPDGHLLCELD